MALSLSTLYEGAKSHDMVILSYATIMMTGMDDMDVPQVHLNARIVTLRMSLPSPKLSGSKSISWGDPTSDSLFVESVGEELRVWIEEEDASTSSSTVGSTWVFSVGIVEAAICFMWSLRIIATTALIFVVSIVIEAGDSFFA
ncbi:hypothetical protein ACFE04_024739 [Oxalis oulophora]